MYSGYGIAFDELGSWSFDNDFARNVLVIFGVDNNYSSHTDNCKNNFLVLREGDNFGEASMHQRKCLVLILVKQRKNFA